LLVALASSPALATPLSVMVDDRFPIDLLFDRLPTARSYGSILENIAQPAVYSIEESAGFSDVDADKVSIYGDSWLWTQWYLDDFDVTDPLFSGTAAITVPYGFLRGMSLPYREAPKVLRGGGVRWHAAEIDDRSSITIGTSGLIGETGDVWPGAVPIMSSISGLHIRDRSTPPPDARRHEPWAARLHFTQAGRVSDLRYRHALDVKQGVRRFLDFDPVTGALDATFDEGYFLASQAVQLEPVDGDHSVTLMAEYTERENLFAELYHSLAETAQQRAGAVFLGLRGDDASAGLTLTYDRIDHRDIEFTRELLDPDGEALTPYFADGAYVGANADVLIRAGGGYVSVNQRALVHVPEHDEWSNQLTFNGAPYGRVDWRAATSMQTIGTYAAGFTERLGRDGLSFDYNAWVQTAYAVNASATNSLLFFDGGFKAQGDWTPHERVDLSMSIGKTPVPITSELARSLDPDAMSGAQRIGAGRLIDTTGGAHTSVEHGLGQSNIYSVTLGGSLQLFDEWQVNLQTIGKIYHNTYRLDFEGGTVANGYFQDGVYFLNEGPKSYQLRNTSDDLPVYVGAHMQLLGTDHETYIVSMAFSHFNAIGVAPFGNGPTANDIGIVHPSTANPNSARHGLANLDNDRGYTFTFLFGGQVWQELWFFTSIAHRDGHPFAYYNHAVDGDQVAPIYRSPRGSPWIYGPKRTGPREDFQLNFDMEVRYGFELAGLDLQAGLLVSNVFDFGNELAENMQGKDRSGLEAEIPRSVMLTLELR